MKMKKIAIVGIVAVLVLCIASQSVSAGINSANVRGWITDEGGNPIVNATVEWKNNETGTPLKNANTTLAGYYSMTHTFEGTIESLIIASKTGYITNSTVITTTAGFIPTPRYEVNFTLKTEAPPDTTPPTTNVTQPPDTTLIDSGTMLDWTNTAVMLSFLRIDPGSGVNYTNLSAETQITNVDVDGTIMMIPQVGTGNLTINTTDFGETFNVTISNDINTKIYYYSVDKNETVNVEDTKNLTVRIKFETTGDININEIMYAPTSAWGGNPNNEWIELYNNDTNPINMTNWEIDGAAIPEATIPGNAYLIIANNDTLFEQFYPSVTCSVVRVGEIALKDTGETIFLNDSVGNINDSANYTDYASGGLGWGYQDNKTLELNASGGWEESDRVGGTPCQPNSVLPPVPFLINGYVFYEDSTPCSNPSVNITNLNIDEEWTAVTYPNASYYQQIYRTADVMAGDTLRFDAKSPSGNQTKNTEYTVTQADVDMGGLFEFDITLEAPPAPSIIGYAPVEAVVNDTEGATRAFNITVDQIVNVSWQINGTEISNETGVAESTYTNASAEIGYWNVSAIATNPNGTAMQTWMWNVTAYVPPVPSIVGYAPVEAVVNDTEGATRAFNITVDQIVNVSWQMNGSEVFNETGVTESTYTNASAEIGYWNVSAIATNPNGTAMQTWMWNVTPYVPPVLSIVDYAPVEAVVNDTEGATRAFNITVDQIVNVSWQMNGSEVFNETGVTESTYTNASAEIGYWNVSAIATNPNGTAMQTWMWNVTPYVPPVPSIVDYAPVEAVVNDTEGATRAFNITVDQIVNVSWQMNGSEIFNETGVTESTYTNASAEIGYWNVSAIATNPNGTAMQTWMWNVYMPVLNTIEVEPSTANLTVSDTQQFTATAYDQCAIPMAGINVTWTSDNETVGTVNPTWRITDVNGTATTTFTANATGNTIIKAENATTMVHGTADVTVYEPEVSTIRVLPESAVLPEGGTQQFTATSYDQHDKEMTVTSTWSVSNGTVGSVDQTGLFTALAEGETLVNATADSVTGSATVTVYAQYTLTISSTAGGSVTVPGEGTFTYNESTEVNLKAVADSGYEFDKWTGDVGTIVNAKETTITMNADYTITANFKKTYIGGRGGGGAPRDTDGDGYTDIQEMIADTDKNDPCDPNPDCAACIALKPAATPTPTPTPTVTVTPTPTPTIPPVVTTPTPTPTPTPGFEAVFAIAGLFAVAYLVVRRKRK